MAKRSSLHRKGSIARKIQDYFLSGAYKDILDGTCEWCWFPIPNNPEFCVALEWQAGYDPEDKEDYGEFMQDEYVINASIKMTDEFSINGEYALYAETYFLTDEEAEQGLQGGISLTQSDIDSKFYNISQYLASDYIHFSKMKMKRYKY